MTTIRSFTNPIHAAFLVTYLHDKEILAVLVDEHSFRVGEGGSIRLQVPDQQAEEATQWLAEFDAAPALPPGEKTDF